MSDNSTHKRDLVTLILGAMVVANPVVLLVLFKLLSVMCLGPVVTFAILLCAKRVANGRDWILLLSWNALAVISVCFHCEAVFRYAFSDHVIPNLYEPHSQYYFNKPCLRQEFSDPEYEATYCTNIQGLRIPDNESTQKVLEKCDWLFLGDSFTQGAQVPYEQLYTSRLFGYFPDKVIVNLGASGFGVAEEYLLLRDIGTTLRPTTVFLQLSPFNDFTQLSPKTVGVSGYLMYYSDLARYLLYNLKVRSAQSLPLGRWTEPFRPTESENIDYNVFYRKTSQIKERDIALLRCYLGKIAGQVRAMSAELIVLLLPTKEQLYYDCFRQVVDGYGIDVGQVDLTCPNRLLRRICDSLGVQLLDLTPALGRYGKGIYFEQDEHLSSFGHSAVAEILGQSPALEKYITGGQRLLGSAFQGNRYPTYVCRGDSILFQCEDGGRLSILLTDSAFGSTPRPAGSQHYINDRYHPAMSPDCQLLAFTEGAAYSQETRVIVESRDGTLSWSGLCADLPLGAIPAFSPSGEHMTFAAWRYDSACQRYSLPQIVISDTRRLTCQAVTSASVESWRPVFGPNSDRIFYISKRESQFDIFSLNLITMCEEALTNTPYDEWDPAISRDGRTLVFAAMKDNNWDLFAMTLDDRDLTQLTHTIGNEWDPSISPTGDLVIFAGEYGYCRGVFSLPLHSTAVTER